MEAQRRFGVTDEAEKISEIVGNRISMGVRRIIESRSFFCFSMAAQNLQPECHFHSRMHGASGEAAPLLKVVDSKTLVFATAPNADQGEWSRINTPSQGIGMILVDVERRLRYRINGRARQPADSSRFSNEWPHAGRVIEVAVAQSYTNCGARVAAAHDLAQDSKATPAPAAWANLPHQDRISTTLKEFIESRPFFFMATCTRAGDCDCSYKGRNPLDSHVVRVIDDRTLVMPDYSGNSMFNTIGNILNNDRASLLFIDVQKGVMNRINGRATVLDDPAEWRQEWPEAKRLITLQTETTQWASAA
jgi:predicted pyridoxine 5'-phosphate oxidase superfamily flavin-nucleotide-binding protein